MDAKEVNNLVAGVLRRLADAPNTVMRVDFQAALRAEAERLTKPEEPKPDFEGVKYVVRKEGTSAPYAVVTERAWRDYYRCEPSARAKLFIRRPDGAVYESENPEWYTPWQPKVDEQVWLEGGTRSGVVKAMGESSRPYVVRWKEGARHTYRLADLRPFSFAPEEPEKPESEDGALVAKDCLVRIAMPQGQLAQLDGGSTCAQLGPGWHPATNAEIVDFIREFSSAVVPAVRAHAKTIAKAARPAGEASHD